MPLLDHFHPPFAEHRHWESFHARWAGVIVDTLEGNLLPKGYFAEVQVHIGARIEADIGTFTQNGDPDSHGEKKGSGAVAVAEEVWAPPAAPLIFPAVIPDEIEVLVFGNEGGPTLVAAIELVSPRNKDRAEARRAFAAKCINYLSQGVGLVIVDVVTDRHANMHNEMVNLMGLTASAQLPAEVRLYAVAYRPTEGKDRRNVHAWPTTLAIGATLPALPLALRNGPVLRLDLEATYDELCRRMRMP